MKDQVLVNAKKQKVEVRGEQALWNDGRPVSKSEMRKLKQIERRKEAQAKLQSVILTKAIFSMFHVLRIPTMGSKL